MDSVSVVIPVGPFAANQRWLPEALQSVRKQTLLPDEVLLVDDMALIDGHKMANSLYGCGPDGVVVSERGFYAYKFGQPGLRSWRSPWRLGVAHAFNFGVALATSNLVFMLGSDDYLEPKCLEECVKEWERSEKVDGYYFVGVHYLDEREDPNQSTPCGAAMVTKGAWQKTGGFAVESAVGTSDANFISQMLVHKAVPVTRVAGGRPLYNYRPHLESDTSSKGPWQGIILETRDLLTQTWQPPAWGRLK